MFAVLRVDMMLLVEVCEAKGNGSANRTPSCCTVMSTAVHGWTQLHAPAKRTLSGQEHARMTAEHVMGMAQRASARTSSRHSIESLEIANLVMFTMTGIDVYT